MTRDEYKAALEHVKCDGRALKNYPEQTKFLCLEAVRQHGFALNYVKEQTDEICLEAVKQNAYALQYVKEQTNDICLAAVNQDGCSVRFVKNQTDHICMAAIQQYFFAFHYVNKTVATDEFKIKAIKMNLQVLACIQNPTEEMCLVAYEQDVRSLGYIWPEFSCVKSTAGNVIYDYLNELTAFAVQRELEWKMHQVLLENETVTSTPTKRRRDVI